MEQYQAGHTWANSLIDDEADEIAGTIAYAVGNPVVNGAVIHANLGQVES